MPVERPVTLEKLRERLAAIDTEILDLVAERQTLSEEIGRVKRSMGRTPRDYDQEKVVLSRARRVAQSRGVPANVADKLFRELIQASLRAQELDQLTASGSGNGQRALIIGGKGKMGAWFAEFLDAQGFEVSVADPAAGESKFPNAPNWLELELDHDIIVVSTPLGLTNSVLHDIAQRRPRGLVFDLASLKSPLRSGFDALLSAGCHATSIHPMYGPSTDLLSGKQVVFIELGVPAATEAARNLFASTMARCVTMPLEQHDRIVAFVLGLSHAVSIIFANALERGGELADVSSTTFAEQVLVAWEVAKEDPDLYFDIQWCNEFGEAALDSLTDVSGDFCTAIKAGDRSRFSELMQSGRQHLSKLIKE